MRILNPYANLKKPETGDRGRAFWPALEEAIQRINDHNHDGSNSAPISGANVFSTTAVLPAASWVVGTNGEYYQDVTITDTVPNGSHLRFGLQFRIDDAGVPKDLVFPVVEWLTSTSFRVYTNDNTVDYRVYYIS